MRQFDICTAFLHGELTEEVYLRPPRGLEHIAGGPRQSAETPPRALRTSTGLQGLGSAARGELTDLGFVQSDADPSLWILYGEGGARLAMFYVDDGLVAARTAAEADELIDLIAGRLLPSAARSATPQTSSALRWTATGRPGPSKSSQRLKAFAIAAGCRGRRGVTGRSHAP